MQEVGRLAELDVQPDRRAWRTWHPHAGRDAALLICTGQAHDALKINQGLELDVGVDGIR